MARKRLEDRMTRKLFRTGRGHSYAMTLPIEAIRRFRWKAGQKVTVRVDASRKRLVIEDWKRPGKKK